MTGRALAGWQDIREELLARIRDRKWRPGDLLPAEAQLASEFGCARATVNRAMRNLADLGLIERRRKAGSRLLAAPERQARFSIAVIRKEVEARRERYSHVLLYRRMARPPAHVAGRLGLPRGRAILHLRTLHLASGNPWAYEDRWLDTRAVAGAARADFSAISANEWLVANSPFTAGELAFGAEAADNSTAEALRLPAGSPVFVIDRTTWNRAKAVTAVRLYYPPGYRVTSRL